jgi:hypothetical protein
MVTVAQRFQSFRACAVIVIARTDSSAGCQFDVISDVHAASLAILRETVSGVFELGDEPAAYPMKVVISIPEPDRLHHAWWFGAPGEELSSAWLLT